jgi:hypothetical protein
MKTYRCWHAASSLLFVGALALGAASVLAEGRDDDKRSGGFGSHPTLPVPAVLVFGAVAVTAAAVAARRRKPKGDARSKPGDHR